MLTAVALLLAASACRPRYSLDRTDELGSPRDSTIDRVPVRGSAVTVVQNDGVATRGELLAVDERYVWVLPPNEDPVSVPRVFVRSVAVTGHATASAQHVDALFQFARFPQGLPSDAPVAPVAPTMPSGAPSPVLGAVPPPPGATDPAPGVEIPPPPGAVPAPPGAQEPATEPQPATEIPPPPGADTQAPPPPAEPEPRPDPYAPAGAPGGETGAALSPPPRGR